MVGTGGRLGTEDTPKPSNCLQTVYPPYFFRMETEERPISASLRSIHNLPTVRRGCGTDRRPLRLFQIRATVVPDPRLFQKDTLNLP